MKHPETYNILGQAFEMLFGEWEGTTDDTPDFNVKVLNEGQIRDVLQQILSSGLSQTPDRRLKKVIKELTEDPYDNHKFFKAYCQYCAREDLKEHRSLANDTYAILGSLIEALIFEPVIAAMALNDWMQENIYHPTNNKWDRLVQTILETTEPVPFPLSQDGIRDYVSNAIDTSLMQIEKLTTKHQSSALKLCPIPRKHLENCIEFIVDYQSLPLKEKLHSAISIWLNHKAFLPLVNDLPTGERDI